MIDWDRIELDYRTGLHTDSHLAKAHGVTISQLKEAAASRGWTQEVIKDEDIATVLSLAESPRFPIDSLFSADDVKRKVLLTAGQVVKVHRDEIAKLRGITTEMTSRLTEYLKSTSGGEPSADDKAIPKLLVICGKESPADLLEKISRIMARMLPLERAAYGLDSMTIIPNEEEENQVNKDIKALGDKIRAITAEKAQKVEPKKPETETPT